MKRLQQCVLCVFCILAIANSCEGRDWRGIVPLVSTRDDVVRVLGLPTNTNDVRSTYHLEDEDIYIVFSGTRHCDFETTKIPAGTVLLVQRSPRAKPGFADLQIDRKKLREFKPSLQDPNWKGFIDEDEGIIIRSYKDTVDRIFYIPTARDRKRFPGYYAEAEEFARIHVHFNTSAFDEYSDLAFHDERARLDNLAIYLQEDRPTWKAYIILYPATGVVSDIQSRGERGKQYLISLGLSEKRISILIGGPRSKTITQLYALPDDWPQPTPNPPAPRPQQ